MKIFKLVGKVYLILGCGIFTVSIVLLLFNILIVEINMGASRIEPQKSKRVGNRAKVDPPESERFAAFWGGYWLYEQSEGQRGEYFSGLVQELMTAQKHGTKFSRREIERFLGRPDISERQKKAMFLVYKVDASEPQGCYFVVFSKNTMDDIYFGRCPGIETP